MSSSKYGKGTSGGSSRKVTFFVPGAGIDREVISTDICRYLGNDATARPGEYTDTKTGETTRGFYVTAYRALTTEQLADIKADSMRWAAEKKQPLSRGQTSGGISPRASDAVGRRSNTVSDGYRQSATRRQQWSDAPQETYSAARDTGRQAPQTMSTGRGYGDSSYAQEQTMGYSGADSGSGYKIASFYEASNPSASNQPRSATQAFGASNTAARSTQAPGQYSYTATSAQPGQYSYATQNTMGSAGMPSTGYQQPRETSPRQPQYVDTRDEEMDDYYPDEYQQDVQPTSGYGRTATREPDRRDDRTDRHRDSGRRHRH